MAALNDKFDVIRGWEPGGDASVDQSLPIHKVAGVMVTLLPGYIVEVAPGGDIDVSTSPNLAIADPIQVYVVLEGNGSDLSPRFLEKATVLRGKLTLKTDKVQPAQVFAVGSPVSFSSGLLKDKAANEQIIGYVLANNLTSDGTINVEVDL